MVSMYSSPRVVASSGRSVPRDPDTQSDQRIDPQPVKRSVRPSPAFGRSDDQVASDLPPIGRRLFRTVTRFSVAVFIGIGATLAWQSYGDEAKEMLVARVPSLDWLLSASKVKSQATAATSTDVVQLAPLALTLDAVRRSVEQVAAKQERLVQNIAALQVIDQDIREKMPSPPQSQQAPSSLQPKPSQSRALAVQSTSMPAPRPPSGQPLRSLESPAQSTR
jgi:hypothetical protein